MKNSDLANDYITRAEQRLDVLELLHKKEMWADVVREAQEVVELALKAVLRRAGIAFPPVHDVGDFLSKHVKKFGPAIAKNLDFLVDTSRRLRVDRELAFYGSEDLTPSAFYREKDAKQAKLSARQCVEIIVKEFES